ncbi:uncharacterized protein PV07_11225 [Cladophialophora immunda]|uniref:Uncharacterized protein n=1 Tax=Cladophialophora immunda TaxID=569365 RepID=A0A0D2CHF6_9EURO|nr:uncharacterized protein PV07_11225 [Cladophialophora immunda]KIW22989.1 hypothetical protein PV07_11225 [Cladophialophora immunda]OQU93722.1 hypothetical protein CLAIMM_00200 [Cladophialophora immunda]
MSLRPTAASARAAEEDDEPVIAGPYTLYSGSFILEFLQPRPSRNASVLMRATYKHDHPLCRKGKAHPQSPPLHLHFQQSESFAVLAGEVGTTTTYAQIDTIHTAQNTPPMKPHHIAPYMPHRFWPSPGAQEDSVILLWAHPNPKDMDDKMDRLFFQSLLIYVSDISEGKEPLSLLQVMLIQHISATALIIFPGLSFLGPLRWWIPWLFQCVCAYMALWMGKKPLLKQYMSVEDWEDEDVQERIGMWAKKDL